MFRNRNRADRVWRVFFVFWDDPVFWQSPPRYRKCKLMSDVTMMSNIFPMLTTRGQNHIHVMFVCFHPADSFCLWSVLCHWIGANLQIFLPETQSKGHQFLPRRCVCGPDWLANHWSCFGNLWVLPLIQVSFYKKGEKYYSNVNLIPLLIFHLFSVGFLKYIFLRTLINFDKLGWHFIYFFFISLI